MSVSGVMVKDACAGECKRGSGVRCVGRCSGAAGGGGVLREAAGSGCITFSTFVGWEAVYHLALPVAFQQPRVERARRVDSVLPGQHCMGRAHRALSEPWQGYLPPALMLFGCRGRRGTPHRAGRHVPARVFGRDASVRHGARRCRHCRHRASRPRRPLFLTRPSTHYAASFVSSYISRIYSTKATVATSCEGRA